MELEVLKIDGTPSGEKVELRPDVFEIEPNDHVIYLAVKAYLANQRQGTHAVKNRSAVRGGGRKPFRQKGTGRARQGTIRAPHMVGGGRAFGPTPRDYRQDLPKKVRKLARKSALAHKARRGKIVVVEDFSFDEPKTRRFLDVLQNLNVNDRKVLFVSSQYDLNLFKSARNVPYKQVLPAPQFSTYDVVNAQVVVFQKGALEKVNEVLGS
ncbi:MAG: 50S ribosomal protein L4 [Calditrichaeota bacterium]|nr:MAG: 50S ribosomal protein L4 [Calditrichota bacterium]